MTTEENLIYQKEFLKEEQEAAKAIKIKEQTALQTKIKRDIPIYVKECYGFRGLGNEQKTDVILARLDYAELCDVIHCANSTKARMVLLGSLS
jgi:hypothetical protein